MAKIRLTKNELKKQKDNLKRFSRYLPTLELKKKQLLQEIRRIQTEIDKLQAEFNKAEDEVSAWVDVFAQDVDMKNLAAVDSIKTGWGNIAGIDIPVFESVTFKETDYDYFDTPFWVDAALPFCRKQIERKINWQILLRQQEIVKEELRTTIQRIKLFEEVKIPEARENIRVIQIFLGDLQTAEVVRGKIAKSKIEKKKQKEVPSV